ncbi:MAG: EF-hand domain-containing protein [Kiloniellales bacterium]
MQTRTKLLLSAAGLAAFATLAFVGSSLAQDGWRHGPRAAGHEGPGFHMGAHQIADHRMARHHGGRHGHGDRFILRLIERYDADGDGKVSQDEIDQGRAERLARFDTDQDGKLSLAEFEALWLEAMRERMVRSFQRFDRDGDGLVTADEYARPLNYMVERHDRSGDGLLGFDDRRKQRSRDDNDG